MNATSMPLPPELSRILLAHGGEPLRLIDDQTQKVYLLIEQDALSSLDDDYLRQLLREADEDVAQGAVAQWDVDPLKREAQRDLAERQAKRQA